MLFASQMVSAIVLLLGGSLLWPASGWTQSVMVNWNDVHQTIDGIGASATSTSCTLDLTDAQARQLFDPVSGIGLSLIRGAVYTGPGWTPELCHKSETRPTDDYTKTDKSIFLKAKHWGVKAWATAWSPPASMKENNNLSDGGALLPAHYTDFANWLAGYIEDMKASGIEMYAVSIANEPDYAASYESSLWDGAQFHDFILNGLKPVWASKGLTTKVMLPETSSWDFSRAEATLTDPNTVSVVSIVAAHVYDGYPSGVYQLAKETGKSVWQTEICDFPGAPGWWGSYDPSMSSALYYARMIHDFFTIAEANAWHHFKVNQGNNMLENAGLYGNSQLDANGQVIPGSEQLAKRAFAIGNFSKFIRPGWVRIGVSADPDTNLAISAYKHPTTDEFAIVVVNWSRDTPSVTFSMNGMNGFAASSVRRFVTSSDLDLQEQTPIPISGTDFSATLAQMSVTTFVGGSTGERP